MPFDPSFRGYLNSRGQMCHADQVYQIKVLSYHALICVPLATSVAVSTQIDRERSDAILEKILSSPLAAFECQARVAGMRRVPCTFATSGRHRTFFSAARGLWPRRESL